MPATPDPIAVENRPVEPLAEVLQQLTERGLRRFPCDVACPDVPGLVPQYAERMFRAQRLRVNGALEWSALILRFGERLFLYARADAPRDLVIFAETEADALTLRQQLAQELAQNAGVRPEAVPDPRTLCLPLAC